jgi:transcriptional regulator with XRE-family HTH domain
MQPTEYNNIQQSSAEARFGARVRELRMRKGLSQRELAERLVGLNLDPTAITRIEKGVRALRLGESLALAHALGTSVEQILQEIADPYVEIGRLEKEADEHRSMARAHATALLAQLKRIEALRAAVSPDSHISREAYYRSVLQSLDSGDGLPIHEPDPGAAAALQEIASALVAGLVIAREAPSVDEDPDHPDMSDDYLSEWAAEQ